MGFTEAPSFAGAAPVSTVGAFETPYAINTLSKMLTAGTVVRHV
jgi:hypothetical protein